jgi:hypothetical protein
MGRPAALFAAVLAVVVLWLYRDVTTLDVALRLLLPALWLAVWTVGCFGAGVWSVRLVLGRGAQPQTVVVLLAGAAALAFSGSVFAVLGVLRPIVLLVVLIAVFLEGLRLLVFRRIPIHLPRIHLASAAGVVLAAAAASVLAVVTTPPVMYDALNYHLAFPSHWLDAGGFVEYPRHLFSYYPSNHGLLYAFSLAAAGPWGAQAIHWWMGLMAVLASATLGERLAGRGGALWAAACFGLTPAVLEIAGYAIGDLAVAAWAGGAIVVLVGSGEQSLDWRHAALAGLLVGSAAASKYLALATVVVPVVIALGTLAWRDSRSHRSNPVSAASAFGIAAAVVLLPWLVRNAVWTGNPVYPYLQAILGGPHSGKDIASEIGRYTSPAASWLERIGSALGALIIRTFNPLRQGGLLGPHWVMLLPVSVFTRGADRRTASVLWAAAVSGFLIWGGLVQYARFLLPALVPAAALAGGAAAALTSHHVRSLRTVFQALIVAVLAWNATVLANTLNLDRIRVVSGHSSQEEFLARWVDYGPLIPFVSSQLPGTARLLLVGEPRSFYLERPVLVEDSYRVPWLVELVRGCGSPEQLAERARSRGATHLLVNETHMQRLAKHRAATDYWEGADPTEREIIERFLSETVRPLARMGGVWIGEIPAERDFGGP